MSSLGTLYLVATPIGNLADISLRALAVLKQVDAIAAEDTRHSSHLLQHYQIKRPLFSLHAHNEQQRTAAIIARLQAGENIALISDAGTPLISDPGYLLVKTARSAGLAVVPVPGPCAAITALCAAGLPTDRFVFVGFLPAKANLRLARLQALANETGTLIFYEAPHRILAVLADFITAFGAEREAVLARELTKTFETITAGTLSQLLAQLQAKPAQQRGEFVLLVKGNEGLPGAVAEQEGERVLKILLKELPVKQAASLAAEITGTKKNVLYKLALARQ